VTCEQFIHSLTGPALEPDPRAEASLSDHVASCRECAALWRAERLLRACTPAERSVALPEELQRELAQSGARRPLLTRWPSVSMLTGPVVALCALLLLAPRADLGQLAVTELLSQLAAPLALSLGLLAIVHYRGATGLGAPAWLRWLLVSAALLAFPALVALQASAAPSVHPAPRDCLLLGLVAGSAVGTLGLWLGRYSALTAPGASGAALGAGAGYAALTLLVLHCPSRLALHLHVAHGLPLLLLILLGALWGRRWLDV
jgi:hypothetical protein